jgi:AcrR family transcriptional regulator
MSTPGIFAAEARDLNKRERTRAKLMDAAVRVFARSGYDAASVNEIAQEADVANGTFYLHFKDKDAIVTEVAIRIASDVTRRLDAAMADLDEAVERVAFATRQFIDLACSHREWGWALVRAGASLPALRERTGVYVRADLTRGVKQGVFKIDVDDFVVEVFVSMIITALSARLDGRAGIDAGSQVAELQLRMLGVAPARARKAARRELTPLMLTPDETASPPRRRARQSRLR